MRCASPRDALAGLLLASIGVGALVLTRDLPIGSSVRMGAGYFPVLISWILIGFGALIFARSFAVAGAPLGEWHGRPLIAVLLAVGAFCLGIERLGLVVSLVAVAVVASFGTKQSRVLEVLISAAVLSGLSTLLFIGLLNLPLRVWPTFLVP